MLKFSNFSVNFYIIKLHSFNLFFNCDQISDAPIIVLFDSCNSKDIRLYCEKLSELDKIVRQMVVESLGLESYIDEHMNSTDYVCRFQIYEAPRSPHPTIGMVPHTDKNIITTLHQLNHVNGLQILTKDGKNWIPADPTSLNSFVVMLGTSFHVCSTN